MNMDMASPVELFKGTMNFPATLYDCDHPVSAIHSGSSFVSAHYSSSVAYSVDHSMLMSSSVSSLVSVSSSSSTPHGFSTIDSFSSRSSVSHSTKYSTIHSESVFSSSSFASSVSSNVYSFASSGPSFSGFEFNGVCDQPVSSLFRVRLSGYEEKCSYFSADGSVSQLDMKFEVSALDITDMDVDKRGMFLR